MSDRPKTRRGVQAYCGCCLYGCYSVYPMLLVSVAAFFSCLVLIDCRMLKITQVSVRNTPTPTFTYTMGFWSVQDFYLVQPTPKNDTSTLMPFVELGNCVMWSDHSVLSNSALDSRMYFGRSITMVVGYSSVLLFLFVWMLACSSYAKCFIHLIAVAAFFLGCCMILIFLVMDSSICQDAIDCEFGADGYCAIFACICWMLLGCFMVFLPGFIDKPFMPNYMRPFQRCGKAYVAWHKKVSTPKEQPRGTTVRTVDEEINEEDGTEIIVTKTRTVSEEGVIVEETVREYQLVPRQYNKASARAASVKKQSQSGEEQPLVTPIAEEEEERENETPNETVEEEEEKETPSTTPEPSNVRPILIGNQNQHSHLDPPTKSMMNVVHEDP